MSNQNVGKGNEIVCVEPDETGESIVYKDGTFYYKNTYEMDNATVRVYNPIPMKKRENN